MNVSSSKDSSVHFNCFVRIVTTFGQICWMQIMHHEQQLESFNTFGISDLLTQSLPAFSSVDQLRRRN